METMKNKQLAKLLAKSTCKEYDFIPEFEDIVTGKIEGYNGSTKQKLLAFLEDMRHGCQSGMIGDFVYNKDCKDFYIRHIDDLESYKEDMEEQLGSVCENRTGAPHYTFVVWLCFEEYCYDLQRALED